MREVKRFEEFGAVREVRSWFPRGFVGIVLKALPFYEVMEFTSGKAGIKDLMNFPFLVILNDHGFGRWKRVARVWASSRFKEGNMEDGMNLPVRRKFEAEGGLGDYQVNFERSKFLFGVLSCWLCGFDVCR